MRGRSSLTSWEVYPFHCHSPRCNPQRVGRRVKCQTTPNTGVSLVRGDRPIFLLLKIYGANSAFSFSVWSHYFHGKYREISAALWNAQAAQLLQDGSSVRLVARRIGVSPNGISLEWHMFRKTGQYSRRVRQGRRRTTTHQQNRHLVLSARRFRRSTASSL